MATLLPQSVCDRAELLCRVHGTRTVAELLGVRRQTIQQLRQRGFKAAERFRPMRPMPSDFAIQSPNMSRDELAVHYGTSHRTIGRWRRELRG